MANTILPPVLPLEQQVSNFAQSLKLKSLHERQGSLFYWVRDSDNAIPYILYRDLITNHNEILCSAYTSAELGIRLPFSVLADYHVNSKQCSFTYYYPEGDPEEPFSEETEALARAACRIHLLSK